MRGGPSGDSRHTWKIQSQGKDLESQAGGRGKGWRSIRQGIQVGHRLKPSSAVT